MTIYTKNGKPILKNVNGVYKLVTGDCCCGCASDSRCGLPHAVIELSFVGDSISGQIKTNTRATLSLSFSAHETIQTIDRNADGAYGDWIADEAAEWSVRCTRQGCDSSSKTAKLVWTQTDSVPDIDLREYGVVTIRFTGEPASSQTIPKARMNANVRRAFKSIIRDDDNPPADYVQGDSFEFDVTMGGEYHIYIVDLANQN